MIPYFEIPTYSLGPFSFQIFGLMAAAGVIVGAYLGLEAMRRMAPEGERTVRAGLPWAVAAGLIGGHLVHVFGYHPEVLAQEGWLVLFKFWEGLSSMGGILGGVLGMWLYLRIKGRRLLPYADPLALGLAPGFAVARSGCFMVHDHPGILTDFFLAVQFPAGARHDMGLYDMLLLAALSGILYFLARRPRPEGLLIGVLAVGYSVPRFFLDFLRADDLAYVDGRIFGLTPAQYITAGLAMVGVFLLVRGIGREPVEVQVPCAVSSVDAGAPIHPA